MWRAYRLAAATPCPLERRSRYTPLAIGLPIRTRTEPSMDLTISTPREKHEDLKRLICAEENSWVRLVFLESDPQASSAEPRLRSEPIATAEDVTTVLAQRRPDLLLVDAAMFFAAGPFNPANLPVSLPQFVGPPRESSLNAIGSPLKSIFEALRSHDRQLPLIVTVPAEAWDGEWVIAAIEAGATDVVADTLPAEQLRDKILLATERRRLQKRPTIRTVHGAACPGRSTGPAAPMIIGTSDAMLSVLCRVAGLAAQPVPVLVHGQPGTGKSLLALTLQRHASSTDKRPLIIDCGQFAAEMLDRLLFEDAAGDVQLRGGLRDQPLILENIDQACDRVQRRLLAAIRQRDERVQRMPSHDAPDSPPPLVMTCSTTVDPARYGSDTGARPCGLIAELLFELSGYAIELPPLRERGGDIRKLIEYFIRTLTGTAPVDETGGEHRITDETKAALEQYDWPGNVTQLRSVLASELRLGGGTIVLSERLSQLTGNRVRRPQPAAAAPVPSNTASLPPSADVTLQAEANQPDLHSPRAWPLAVERFVASAATGDGSTSLYGETIQEVEAGLIAAVLEKTQGNLAQSARLLGITRVSLRRKIHALGVPIPGRTGSS